MGINQDLLKLKNPEKAKIYQGFFKTGKGEYGEGDVFLGLTMPQVRIVAKKHFRELGLVEIKKILTSKYHEFRMAALVMLTYQYAKADDKGKKKIYDFYLKNTKWINNWDLVDVTCNRIVGFYLLDKPKERKILYKLAKSKNLWERRIAIVSTGVFIARKADFADTIKLCELLITDKHDLIHKACGWMLREVGKKEEKAMTGFLDKHYQTMPRTMLRYAIERFEEKKRRHYLGK